jgi:DNA-binding transcriptional regulator YdaS (Cro superfamily)
MDITLLRATEGEVGRARLRYDILREEVAFHNFNS